MISQIYIKFKVGCHFEPVEEWRAGQLLHPSTSSG